MPRSTPVTLAATALVASAIISCDKSPTQPTPLTSQPSTTTSATPSLQSIRIEGPMSVPPGTNAQYTAVGLISDGTTRDMTSTVTWRSSDDAVLAISPSGSATGGKPGEAVIAVENNGKRAGLGVLVLAPGTFRLTGLASDGGVPVSGLTVDLLDGSRAIMSTKTDGNGIYRLYGVAGDIEVRVSGMGYPEQVNRLTVTGEARSDFVLTSRSDQSGSYQLRITASASRPSSGSWALPAEARVRTYDGTITQNGPHLSVALSGAPLIYRSFTGTVNGGTVTFDIHGVTIDY